MIFHMTHSTRLKFPCFMVKPHFFLIKPPFLMVQPPFLNSFGSSYTNYSEDKRGNEAGYRNFHEVNLSFHSQTSPPSNILGALFQTRGRRGKKPLVSLFLRSIHLLLVHHVESIADPNDPRAVPAALTCLTPWYLTMVSLIIATFNRENGSFKAPNLKLSGTLFFRHLQSSITWGSVASKKLR